MNSTFMRAQARIAWLAATAALLTSHNIAQSQPRKDLGEHRATGRGDDNHRPKHGAKAPPLDVSHWLAGAPISEYASGQVYVVAFWSDRCAHCLRHLLELSDLQRRFQTAGVRVIGVYIANEEATDAVAHARMLMTRHAVVCSIAYDGESRAYQAFRASHVTAGFPVAYIIDRQGTIAYAARSDQIEWPLAKIVNGEWEPAVDSVTITQANEAFKRAWNLTRRYGQSGLSLWYQAETDYPFLASAWRHERWTAMLAGGLINEAYVELEPVLNEALARDDWLALQAIAREITDPRRPREHMNFIMALRAAGAADQITEHGNAQVLSDLAHVLYMKGDVSRAIEVQNRAIDVAETAELRQELQSKLAVYTAETAPRPGASYDVSPRR